jgi:ribosomal protein S18 acetylase RimI-like enzyme
MSLPETALAPALARALSLHQPDIGLRVETAADLEFQVALYTSVRWEELAPVDWPEAAKRDFLAQQARLQHAHYLEHYAGAELLVITAPAASAAADGSDTEDSWIDATAPARRCIGRIYLRSGSTEVRLMDVALFPPYRGQGLGRCLIEALQSEAAARGLDVTLHVEPTNPAQRLYQRLGFTLIEQRGVYDFLGWSPDQRRT